MIILLIGIIAGILIGRDSTVIWRTEHQKFREQSIDWHARRGESPGFPVDFKPENPKYVDYM